VVIRELILLRHAHAVPAAIDGQDIERPLSGSGEQQARQAAQRLRADELLPELILTSPARRAAETARLLLLELALPATTMRVEPPLYMAEPAVLRSVISRCPAEIRRLLLVGHNPGLSELLTELLPRGPALNLATGEYFCMTMSGSGWDRLRVA
jgi:phosphohistidine phosphatase SixA